jgi:ornithine lipid ester-linked acyl 2-hydroxylase
MREGQAFPLEVFDEPVDFSRGRTLVVFLDRQSPDLPLFTKALALLADIAGAPAILAVLDVTGPALDDYRADPAVRFRVVGLPCDRFAALVESAPTSFVVDDGVVTRRRRGGLPPETIAILRTHIRGHETDPEAIQRARRSDLLVRCIERHEAQISLLPDGNRTFFDPADFPWVAGLQAGWRAIRAELDLVLGAMSDVAGGPAGDPRSPLPELNAGWRIFSFMVFGLRNPDTRARCPETTRLLDTVPGLSTALFSILEPRAYLPPHRGPFKGVLRYHLGLRVPGPSRIRVGDEVAYWAEGESLIFDDTHEHEVWNECDEPRAVLFLDFLRPLPAALEGANRILADAISRSPYLLKARQTNMKWEAEVGANMGRLRREQAVPMRS